MSQTTSKLLDKNPLKVMVIFAHPDEGEIYAGGVTALYTQMGHKVKFLSLTNGDAGHYAMEPQALAKRRYQEAMQAKDILSLADYTVLDYHDGVLENTKTIQAQVAQSIQAWEADVVFAYYPVQGGHQDNMTAGWIVREAATLLPLEEMPVFIYIRDYHTCTFSYIPDFAVIIDTVWETKLAACEAHESQVLKSNPYHAGILEEVLASKEKQAEFLYQNTYPYSRVTSDNKLTLIKWYGGVAAEKATYAEAFEIAEYGRQITEEEVTVFFPMIGQT